MVLPSSFLLATSSSGEFRCKGWEDAGILADITKENEVVMREEMSLCLGELSMLIWRSFIGDPSGSVEQMSGNPPPNAAVMWGQPVH